MNATILSIAFLIGISGADGQTINHLNHQIAWTPTVQAEKQNVLKPARFQYLSVTLPETGKSTPPVPSEQGKVDIKIIKTYEKSDVEDDEYDSLK